MLGALEHEICGGLEHETCEGDDVARCEGLRKRSSSLTSRLHRVTQANELSTTQRVDDGTKPVFASASLTTRSSAFAPV